MSKQALAVTYRPTKFEDVVEQYNVKIILTQQLDTGTIKNAYLFCGGAGTGKTTCARIFANEINHGEGNPIEMDAASHNGVDDVRSIIQQAKTKSIDSEYKIFIIDECHAISNTGWQAFLKIIEEPPAKSIFIFCTTDPQKIPKTILSRVQRYNFHRISQQGIIDRLRVILEMEESPTSGGAISRTHPDEIGNSLEYIAKLADGGMRDAISLMDKALSFSTDLSLNNVVKALGAIDYEDMMKLTDDILDKQTREVIHMIETLYNDGKDMKQFIKSYLHFLLDVQKYVVGCDWKYLSLPKMDVCVKWFEGSTTEDFDICLQLLDTIMKLNTDIKYSSSVKYDIEACLVQFIQKERL